MSTPYMTRVAIANRAGVPLLSMRVMHMFGDQALEVLVWDTAIESGEGKLSDTRNVSYVVGFGDVTKYDRWLVSWRMVEAGQEFICTTAPSLFDLVGDYLIVQEDGSVGAIVDTSDITKSMSEMGGSLAKLQFGAIACKVDESQLKEHVLREEDAYDPAHPADIGLKLLIGDDATVTFESPSGNSQAGYAKMAVPHDLPAAGY